MSPRHHRGHNGCNNQSSSHGSGAPTYIYDLLQQAPSAPYGQQMAPAYGQPGQQVMPRQQPSGYGVYPGQDLQHLQAEEHRHRQNEHGAEMGVVGAVAFAAYEKHEERVDPAHAHRHHVEAQVAEAAAVGQGGFALYEHHELSEHNLQAGSSFGWCPSPRTPSASVARDLDMEHTQCLGLVVVGP